MFFEDVDDYFKARSFLGFPLRTFHEDIHKHCTGKYRDGNVMFLVVANKTNNLRS